MRRKIVGIYRITSPSGRVYIGQSRNINKRFNAYINYDAAKQTVLFKSFKKYGTHNHIYEVIHELPPDVGQLTIDEYEIYYISQYKECGIKSLNIRLGGSHGKHSEKTKEKLREIHKNHPCVEAARIRMKEMLKGNQYGKCNKGRPCSEEKKEKLRKHFTGTKHTEETKRKVKEISKNMWAVLTSDEREARVNKIKSAVTYKKQKYTDNRNGQIFNSMNDVDSFFNQKKGTIAMGMRVNSKKWSFVKKIPNSFTLYKGGEVVGHIWG